MNLKFKDWTFIHWYALTTTWMAFVFGILLFFVVVPHENKTMVDVFITAFIVNGFGTIIGFFFGNSHKTTPTDDEL